MKRKRNSFRSLTTITQFGINMIVPIFMCSFLGMYVDRKLGTSFFMILLFFLGAIAGFWNVYKLAMKIGAYEEREERRHVSKNEDNAANR